MQRERGREREIGTERENDGGREGKREEERIGYVGREGGRG